MKMFLYYDINERKALEKYLKGAELINKTALKTAGAIISSVRSCGDKSLFSYTRKFDKFSANKTNIRVKESELRAAIKKVPAGLLNALKAAKVNIEKYHKKQLNSGFVVKTGYGELKMRAIPVESAGVYIPGGKAVYPSSVLMNLIPAKLAGVPRIVLCTPARNGKISPVILAAANICGVKEIYKAGGAQAIAALAYGTESIKAVVKITGPGNIYVAAAKKLIFGKAGIDSIAGPSEILIVASGENNPEYAAADMLAQAEHDEKARSILITDSVTFAGKVLMFINFQKKYLTRRSIVREAIKNCVIIIVKNIKDAVELSNNIAPEHLELFAKEAIKNADLYINAGAVFIGENSMVALGDYLAGTNHVLPTGGTAKFSSPLGVYDFIKYQSVAKITEKGLKLLKPALKTLAGAEGLDGHWRSAELRRLSVKRQVFSGGAQ